MELPNDDLNTLLQHIQQMRQELDRLRLEVIRNQDRVASLESELRKTALWRAMASEEKAAEDRPIPPIDEVKTETPPRRIRTILNDIAEPAPVAPYCEKEPILPPPRPAPPPLPVRKPIVSSPDYSTEPKEQKPTSKTEKPVTDLESSIGIYWFSRLGALTLLVGFVVFARWIHQYLTPSHRVTLCYIAAFALYATGYYTQKRYPRFAFPVMASGLILAFFTGFAGHFIDPMRCFPLGTSTVLMLAASAWTIYVSWAYRSQTLAGLSLFMGFWVAVAATSLSDSFTPVILFFLAFMGVEFLLLLNWPLLFALSILGVYGVELWWDITGTKNWPPETVFWIEMGFLTLYYIVFMAGEVMHRLGLKKESEASPLETFAPPGASGVLNAVLFFILGSYAFTHPQGYWDHLHYFYWPLGLFLTVQGLFLHRRESILRLETSVLYVFACGLITLGFASAFDGMQLGNVLALEGLCLFALHRITGLSFILVLRAIAYLLAYTQFNIASFNYSAHENDWSSFAGGLPAVIFLFAPALLMPLWPLRVPNAKDGERTKRLEGLYAHIHAIFASLMLVRLAAETLRPETAYAGWILLVPLGFAAAAAWPRFPALGSLAGAFLVFAQIYFFYLWQEIKTDGVWWLLPASVILFTYYILAQVFLEIAVRRRDFRPDILSLQTALLLLACSVLLAVLDAALLINLRIDPPLDYPFALGLAIVLLALSAFLRLESLVITGLAMLGMGCLFLFYNCLDRSGDISPGFFAWSMSGALMTLVFERLLYCQVGRITEWEHLRRQRIPLTIALAATLSLVLLVLIHHTSWIQKEYETVALTAIALLLFGLGACFRSSAYRRLGLGVFLIALARVYLVDLSGLATVYKIIAFMILGAVLMGVSYLYARYREQFQKWM